MKLYKKQSGAVLAISLVMLTAITFLAIMGMERSGLQTRIVANIKIKEIVFNEGMAENDAAIFEYRYFDNKVLSDAMERDGEPIPTRLVRDGHPLVTTISNVRYRVSAAVAEGAPATSRLRESFSRGVGSSGIEEFELQSLATADGTGSSSNQFHGFGYIVR